MANITVPTRANYEENYLRAVRMRNPNAKTGPDEYYSVQARNLADQLATISASAVVIAGNISLRDMTGSQLDNAGRPVSQGGLGVPRPAAVGANGYLTISTVASGTDITVGMLLTTTAGVTYTVATGASGHYTDGTQFAVVCAETGPETNLDAGTVLTWSSPAAGCFAPAVVFAQPDGSGLIGGREALGDDDYRELLADAQANPAASSNDAELQRQIQYSRGHGVAVKRAFTYPCCLGPSTTGFAFVLEGGPKYGSRIPSSAQINLVAAWVELVSQSTDMLWKFPLIVDPVSLSFQLKWLNNGWVDPIQWPPYIALASRYLVSGTPTPTIFTVSCADSVYTSRAIPVVGQRLGLFDKETGEFVLKTIKSFTGTGPWTITCETLANASDLVYTPLVGQWVSPWSPSLQSAADIALKHINAFGPGEMISSLPGDGIRMTRSPKPSTGKWPYEMDSQLEGDISRLPTVQRANHVDGADYVTTVGDGTHVHLASLFDLGFYPL
jgi:uncharacterized phage protein gp47/JayE